MVSIINDNNSNIEDLDKINIPDVLPLLAARDVVIYSHMITPLFIGRDSSILAVEEAMSKDRIMMVATQKDASVESPEPEDIFEVGTLAMIMRMLKMPDGRLKVLVQGLSKAKIIEFTQTKPYACVKIKKFERQADPEKSAELEALLRNVREQSEQILSLKGLLSPDVEAILSSMDSPGQLADLVASNLRLGVDQAQEVLEIIDPVERLTKVSEFLNKELEVSTIQAKIQSEAQDEMSRSQREFFLREQLRAIKRELGDTDDRAEEIREYRDKIGKAKMPPDIEKEADKQLIRLDQMHRDAAEASMLRTYLDWLVEIPWSKSSRDNLDLIEAQKVLNADHYGLEKIKERILEYLAVRKLNKKSKGPILCFVGPPGVGKTSLGQSIARAMGRKFTRLSLGGMKDEAEIRGHRRTYIGALPGRIVQGLKTAGTNNPVFMLDEVDKIGNDFRGDPSAALLEVLDPEQNYTFSDHYLNLPLDLSKVMFITTANHIDPIPPALEDRMEVIRLSGYTEDEKLAIAKKFLLPRQIKENGLKPKDIHISDQAILKTISGYTEEAGLRNLEQKIGAICRKCARKVAEGSKSSFKITVTNLKSYLGVPEFLPEPGREKGEIGVATGLAWTQAGGELLYIETRTMAGKGNLILTGQLGDVMKESAQAALSLARERAGDLNLPEDFYENLDIHIHVPAGAIPKDGPSAGITMTVAMISALTDRPIPTDVALTGEVTLRGKILPIGGLKEKTMAALRADIHKVIIPAQNLKDLEELSPKIKRQMEFIPVKNVNEVLDIIFPPIKKKKTKPKKKIRKKTK